MSETEQLPKPKPETNKPLFATTDKPATTRTGVRAGQEKRVK